MKKLEAQMSQANLKALVNKISEPVVVDLSHEAGAATRATKDKRESVPVVHFDHPSDSPALTPNTATSQEVQVSSDKTPPDSVLLEDVGAEIEHSRVAGTEGRDLVGRDAATVQPAVVENSKEAELPQNKTEKRVPFFLKDSARPQPNKVSSSPRPVEEPAFPYPEDWLKGDIEMTESNLAEVVDSRRRPAELPTITLPTSEKTIKDDFTKISIDAAVDKISTVIAAASTNRGTLESHEGVLIQGKQIGDIKIDASDLEDPAGTVVVSRPGVVTGDISGKRVVVFGRVEGSIRSETHITLAETAVVTGDLYYRKMRMMDGAEIEGNCQKIKDEEA